MHRTFVIALLLSLVGTPMAQASLTLEGNVEKTDLIAPPVHVHSSVEGRIGVRISHWGHVGYVHPGSPAEQAGLKKRDTVVLVDGKRRAINSISGEPGTNVILEVRRGFENFTVSVPRVDYRSIRE